MAKIYGVELKAVKYFEGREGIGFTSNIYLNNKKIGRFLDYADGAMVEYNFDLKAKEEELEKIAEKYFQDYPKALFYENYKVGEFLEELLQLKEREEQYKKLIKKNDKGVLLIGSYHKRTEHPGIETKLDETLTAKFYNEKSFEDYKKKQGYAELYIYKSLEDFIIK